MQIFWRSGTRSSCPLVGGLLLEHLAVADDRVERRPQLVAHVREERALGPIRGFCRLLRLFGRGSRLFGRLARLLHLLALLLDLLFLEQELLLRPDDAPGLRMRIEPEDRRETDDRENRKTRRERARFRIQVKSEKKDRRPGACRHREKTLEREAKPADAQVRGIDGRQQGDAEKRAERTCCDEEPDDERIGNEVAELRGLAVAASARDEKSDMGPEQAVEAEQRPEPRLLRLRQENRPHGQEDDEARGNPHEIVQANDRVKPLFPDRGKADRRVRARRGGCRSGCGHFTIPSSPKMKRSYREEISIPRARPQETVPRRRRAGAGQNQFRADVAGAAAPAATTVRDGSSGDPTRCARTIRRWGASPT